MVSLTGVKLLPTLKKLSRSVVMTTISLFISTRCLYQVITEHKIGGCNEISDHEHGDQAQ